MTIVSYSVCDFCGDQVEIVNNKFCGLSMTFTITLTSGKADWKNHSHTFCNRDCLIEYMRIHITNEGFVDIINKDKTNA